MLKISIAMLLIAGVFFLIAIPFDDKVAMVLVRIGGGFLLGGATGICVFEVPRYRKPPGS